MYTLYKTYRPYMSPFDPCPPITEKVYSCNRQVELDTLCYLTLNTFVFK